jgi:hypothetical protein
MSAETPMAQPKKRTPQRRNPSVHGKGKGSSLKKGSSCNKGITDSLVESKHFVEHNYHDHVNDKKEDYTSNDTSTAKKKSKSSMKGPDSVFGAEYRVQRARGGVTIPFPLKLHRLLDTIEQDGYGDVVSWQPHGRAFSVHKPAEFVSVVMPTYFKQTKLTSFQRQLNLYGFRRLTKGVDTGAYYHELFLRGSVFLCHKMTRTKIKGTGCKAASSPETEPDFYKMPFARTRFVSMDETPVPKSAETIIAPQLGSSTAFDIPKEVFRADSFVSLSDISCHASPLIKDPALPIRFPVKPVLPSAMHYSSSAVPITPECLTRKSVHDLVPSLSHVQFPGLPVLCSSGPVETHDEQNHAISTADRFAIPSLAEPEDDVVLFEGRSFHYLPTTDIISFQLNRRLETANDFVRSLSSDCFPEVDTAVPSFMRPDDDQLIRLHEISQEWD